MKRAETGSVPVQQITELIERNDKNREQKLQDICQILADHFDAFDWVGFYLVDPDADRELILGPFVGAPTEHIRIAFGEGICGQAAETNKTFVVQDVDEADNYLSCSAQVRAEIVVPIKKDGDFVAELDIDSHNKNSITAEHRTILEDICVKIARLF